MNNTILMLSEISMGFLFSLPYIYLLKNELYNYENELQV